MAIIKEEDLKRANAPIDLGGDYRTVNAVIEKAEIGYERDAFLTFRLWLGYGGGGQMFGGVVLGKREDNIWGDTPNIGARAIDMVLSTVGVENWSDLNGKAIRAIQKHDHVRAIGHIVEYKWFDLECDLDPDLSKEQESQWSQ